MSSILRREFIRRGLTASAGLALPTSFIIKSANSASPNDEIGLGQIGMGGRGGELNRSFNRSKRRSHRRRCPTPTNRALKRWPTRKSARPIQTCGNCWKIKTSTRSPYRHATTGTVWRPLWRCRPVRTFTSRSPYPTRSGKAVRWSNAARKYNRIVQLGTQQRSDLSLQDAAKKFIHEDNALGKILYAQVETASAYARASANSSSPLKVPPVVDYDLWLGPAEDQKIYRNELHYDWHWDFNTGNGEMGNWGRARRGRRAQRRLSGLPLLMPKRVLAVGGRVAWGDAGDTPNVHFRGLRYGKFPMHPRSL